MKTHKVQKESDDKGKQKEEGFGDNLE